MTVPRGTLSLPAPAPKIGDTRDFLMLVKTYPVPSTKYGETVCCAAIDATTGGWRRIYPVNFRSLRKGEQFKKWQFIRAGFASTTQDPRPESIRIFQETIAAGEFIQPRQWARRRTFTDPLVRTSLETLLDEQRLHGTSLGVIRPRSIDHFVIQDADRWDRASSGALRQLELAFDEAEVAKTDLEPIPFQFKYRFHCDDDRCRGHEMAILDWEIAQAYRSWRRTYPGDAWKAKLREKYFEELPARELHLILGTHHRYGNWMIVGVFAIPRPKVGEQKRTAVGHRPGEQLAMALPWVELETQERDPL